MGSLSLSAQQPVSPNGKLTVSNSGQGISVNYQKQEVLNIPVLGYEGIKSNRLKFKPIGKVTANYQMLAGKKSTCTNEANEYVAKLSGNLLDAAVDRQLRGILPHEHHWQNKTYR